MVKFYGVWIPAKGWLAIKSKIIAFDTYEMARSTAKRMRQYARPEPIDDSLSTPEMEQKLLENEILPLFMRMRGGKKK